MSLTNFPNGITSFGVPIMGSSGPIQHAFGTVLFVDGVNGSDGNSGLSSDQAYATIQKAFDNVSHRGTIYVVPQGGSTAREFSTGYTETLTTPTWNSGSPTASHVNVVGADPTGWGVIQFSAGASATNLTLRAHNWRISGFQFDAPTSGNAMVFTRTGGAGDANFSNHCQVDNCLFTTGQDGIDITGAPFLCNVYDNVFENLSGNAIEATDAGVALAFRWRVIGNQFNFNANHINMNPRGFNAAVVSGNVFALNTTTEQTATVMCDLGGGRNNMVFGNVMQGNYGTTNRNYVAGTTDMWDGNLAEDSAAIAGDPWTDLVPPAS